MRGRPRLLLLVPTSSYRTEAFVEASRSLDIDLTVASEVPSTFEPSDPDNFLTLDFADSEVAIEQAEQFHRRNPIGSVVGVDDGTTVLAAAISEALNLEHISVDSAIAARDKHRQREILSASGVAVPDWKVVAFSDGEHDPGIDFPVVVKPLALSASRGVIRANDEREFLAARETVESIVRAVGQDFADERFLVERFVPGPEFAIEGLVLNGELHQLALFDKPDPLDGPYFEETIYVTPSRHSEDVKRELYDCAAHAVSALGIDMGPVHAELRYHEGPYVIEVAARSIGGRCSNVLRFGSEGGSLEQILVKNSLGLLDELPVRSPGAAGVMMIPIQRAGKLEAVSGVEKALQVELITDVIITAHRGQMLVPLPEGSQYLGFIFAHGREPAEVEAALREAHGLLDIRVREGLG